MLDDQQNIKNNNVKTILPLKISSICTLHWFIRQQWKILLLVSQKLNNLLCKYASYPKIVDDRVKEMNVVNLDDLSFD
jgi:hypothetical protein